MNRATLQERELWFIERLKEQDKFEYIGGYTTMKDNVILKHKRCGKTVMQKAYTVIYSNIDKCYECDRHRRGYESIKENIKHSDTLGIVSREKFGTRYRYKCQCRVCGEMYYFNKKQLEEGITCCSGTTSRIERIVNSKANEIIKEVKNSPVEIKNINLYELIKNSYNDIALLRTCIVDTEKLFTKIQKKVEAILEKKEIGNCPICNKKIKNKTDWRVDFTQNKQKICKKCKNNQKSYKNVSNL